MYNLLQYRDPPKRFFKIPPKFYKLVLAVDMYN